MSILKKASVLVVAAAMAVTVAACGGSGAEGPARSGQSLSTEPAWNPQPYDNVRDGGTFTYTLNADLNPQFNVFQGDMTADTRTVWNWYNPFLITFSPKGDALVNPDYLTSATPSLVGGNTKVVYTINPKATYNDGSPIDWRSFEATWKANSSKNPAYIVNSSDGYDRIASVTRGTDGRQAVVTYRGVNVWWQGVFNNLLNPRALAPETFNKGYLNTPHPEWGAGPYTLSRYDKQNGTISFTRNPKWWGKPGKLDTVTLVQMDVPAAVNAFRNGQLDATEAPNKEALAQARSAPGAEIRTSVRTTDYLFTLNGRTPILRDPAVRKAIFQGVDRAQLPNVIFQGLDYSEPLPGSVALKSFQPGYQDNVDALMPFDPEQAKGALDAAGWVPGPDGVRAKAGKPLEFTYVQTGDTATKRAVSAATIAMMKNIGVRMNVRQVPSSDFSKILAGKQFDLLLSGYQSTDPYGIAYICQTYCANSTLNNSGTGQKSLDPQVQAVTTLPTAEQQYAAANDVERKALATYGLLPLYNGPEIWATKPGLANFGSALFAKALPETIGWQK